MPQTSWLTKKCPNHIFWRKKFSSLSRVTNIQNTSSSPSKFQFWHRSHCFLLFLFPSFSVPKGRFPIFSGPHSPCPKNERQTRDGWSPTNPDTGIKKGGFIIWMEEEKMSWIFWPHELIGSSLFFLFFGRLSFKLLLFQGSFLTGKGAVFWLVWDFGGKSLILIDHLVTQLIIVIEYL